MFEKKNYSKEMKALRQRVAFRLDYFSLPTFKEKYFDIRGEISNDYVEGILTEDERQMVDLDAVAYNLGETLDNILVKKAYHFFDVVFDEACEIKGDVIVSPYFLFLQIVCDKDGAITEKCVRKLYEYLSDANLESVTTTKMFTCQADHQKVVDSIEDISKIIGDVAFCHFDAPRNSNYLNEYVLNMQGNEIDASLKRYIQQSIDNKTGEIVYNILVNSILSMRINGDFSLQGEDIINSFINYSELETSRCFTI